MNYFKKKLSYLCCLKTPLPERSLDPVSKDNSDAQSSHPPRPLCAKEFTQVLQFLHLRISFLSPRNTPWHFREYIFFTIPLIRFSKFTKTLRRWTPLSMNDAPLPSSRPAGSSGRIDQCSVETEACGKTHQVTELQQELERSSL